MVLFKWGPLLFLLYVNDIPNVPFTKDSPLVMYADDLLQYQNDLLTFQCDVNLISQWTLQTDRSTAPLDSILHMYKIHSGSYVTHI